MEETKQLTEKYEALCKECDEKMELMRKDREQKKEGGEMEEK